MFARQEAGAPVAGEQWRWHVLCCWKTLWSLAQRDNHWLELLPQHLCGTSQLLKQAQTPLPCRLASPCVKLMHGTT
jgi:hypothetical protein